MDQPRKPGRPSTGRTRRHEIHSYADDDENRILRALARRWERSIADTIRRSFLEAARREKVAGGAD